MGPLLHRGLQPALLLPHMGHAPAKREPDAKEHQQQLEEARPPRSPPGREDTEREGGRLGTPDSCGTPRQDFERVGSGREAGEAHLALACFDPTFIQPFEPVTETNARFVQKAQAREANYQRVIVVGNLEVRRWLYGVLAALNRRHLNRGRNFGCRIRGHVEAREPAAGAYPHAAATAREQRVADAVIPEQSLGLAVVPPLLTVKHVHTIIGAGPQPSARIGHERSYLIRLQPVLFREVLQV